MMTLFWRYDLQEQIEQVTANLGLHQYDLLLEKDDMLINELRVTTYYPYELRLLYDLRVTFCVEVTNYCLLYELLFTYKLRLTVYCTIDDLLLLHELQITFCIRVTSYCLLHKLRVTLYCTSFGLLLLHELRAVCYIRITSTMSYDKDEDDKAVTIIKLQ